MDTTASAVRSPSPTITSTTSSALAKPTHGNYLDEVWTLDDRRGPIWEWRGTSYAIASRLIKGIVKMKITAVKYTVSKGKRWTKKIIFEFASHNNLQLSRKYTEAKDPMKVHEVERYIKKFFSPAEISLLRVNGNYSISKFNIKALKRSPILEIFEYAGENISMTVEFAKSNCITCLSAELWLNKRIRFPGCFIEVSSSNKKKEVVLFKKLQRKLWSSCPWPS